MFEYSVIQGTKDLIRLIKKLWLGSNKSHSFFKAPFGYTGFALSFHNSVFWTRTSLVPQPFHFLSISLDKMERIQPNLVWLIGNTLISPIFSSPEPKAHKVGL